MFKRILVAVDGTLTSNRGLVAAIGLAREQKATLHVVHVIDALIVVPMLGASASGVADYVDTVLDGLRKSGRKIVSKAQATAGTSVTDVRAEMVESAGRSVASVILGHAKRVRADLIVLGTHGRRGLSRLLVGSDAEAVLREADVPVLLVRSPKGKRRSRPSKSAKSAAAQARTSTPSRAFPGLERSSGGTGVRRGPPP